MSAPTRPAASHLAPAPTSDDVVVVVTIDRTRCTGHGICAALLPGRIQLDEWGYPIFPERNSGRFERVDAARATSYCPARALSAAYRG
jgi:ferredoxin